MFTLAKWYLDLVTDDGTAIIGYSARLAAGALRVGYSSVLQSVAGVPANEMTALGQAEPPFGEDELVTWHQRSSRCVVAGSASPRPSTSDWLRHPTESFGGTV